MSEQPSAKQNEICGNCGKQKSNPAETAQPNAFDESICVCTVGSETTTTASETADLDQSTTLRVGDLISERYEVLAHIGSGGMGEVYKVLDRQTQKFYALKMIAPHLARQKTVAKRLEHEAQAARTLVHGNIASVYDVGTSADGAPYLIMDYIDGDSLDALIKTETVLSQKRAVPIFMQIAEALVHAQQKQVIHRDLKPSNILMTKTEGGEDMVKIVDFGIAKVADKPNVEKTKLTQTGELLGTPLYMSPEQCRGDELDARSDIYSCGCIMYEVLTGAPPFTGENPVRVILKHLSDTPAPLPVNSGISLDLKRIVMRCLEKDPDNRYPTPVDLHIDLERLLDGRPIKSYKRKVKISRRVKIGAAVAAIVIVGTAAAAVLVPSSQKSETASLPVPQQLRPDTYKGKTLAQWTNLIEKTPDDPELYYSRAMLHVRRDERNNAIDDLSEALKLKPDYLEALRERATEYVRTAMYAKGAADAEKVIKLDPDSARSYETRGWLYSTREQYALAIADWTKAISLSDSPYYRYQLASEQFKLGLFDDAMNNINEAIQHDDQASYRGIAGLVSTFKQDYDTAHDQFTKAVSMEDGRGVEWALLAYYYVAVGKMDEAEKALKQAKELETFPARSLRLSGEVYRTAGQYEQALHQFSASTSLEEYPPGYRERAVTHISLGQWRSAYGDLKKAYELNPYSSTTISYLALVEDQIGMKKEAKEHMALAFREHSVPPIVYVNRANMELANGDLPAALNDAHQSVKLDQWLKEGYESRSKIYQKMGDAARSKRDSERAAKLTSHLDY